MESRSLKLAQEFAKDALKATKGGWFSKPEWETAAQYWDKAAASYKTACHYEEAADCYSKASEAYVHVNAIYLAAKCAENAATLAEKHLKDQASTIAFYSRASDLMMEKAAKSCEGIDINRAIQLYDSALSIYESEDRGRFAIDTFKRVTRFLIDNNRLTEAIAIQERLVTVCEQINNRSDINRARLSVIILLLAFGDSVEAGKKLDEYGQDISFVRSKEAGLADYMIQAYNNGDQDIPNAIFLESSIARLAARIRVPGGKRLVPNVDAQARSPTGTPQITYPPTPGGNSAGAAPLQTAVAIEDEDDDLL
ncbi:hypothetical protein BX661DRAFT_181307 [Kickxella alabastrina]|uniref:uncharacterized protein n=1 Tax=Kickxella alabastrina TaxID=61397 RepID=UPI00221FB75A|nr:uncharacterized protein BX661DRAFT_181307 [Kickxella alabastrina]KAI7829057.1 hypothetical protein BX661DRAFT_181307 [Kickxella alabastrina]